MLQSSVRVTTCSDKVLAAGVLANRGLINAYFGASRPQPGRLAVGPRWPLGVS